MSYTPPNQNTYTSPDGINSDNIISGGNWVANTYTGTAELVDFNYIGINLQTDEDGTLTILFSQDGINFSQYPVTEFTVNSGINEVHGAWKGNARYIRVRFTGTGGRTYFRLKTMYSNDPVLLTAPLNQELSTDQDATVVRSVNIGESPINTLVNQKIDGLAFSTNSNLGISGVFSTSILNGEGYTQVQTHITSDQDGTMTFEFYSDIGGTDLVRTLNVPYVGGSGYKLLSAPMFTPYIKYTFTNGTIAQTDFYFDTKFLTKPLSGQLLDVEGFISPTMVATLDRSVVAGEDPNNSYINVKTGGYHNSFSSNTPLGIGANFDSGIIDLEGFTQLWTEIESDVAGTLVGTWYDDAAGTNVLRTFTAPYDPSDDLFFSTTVVLGKYLRYTFTNGASAQSRFHMRVKLDNSAYSGQMLKVESFIPTNVLASLTRSVLVGKDTDGIYQNVNVNKGNALLTGDFFSEVALSNIDNYAFNTKFGGCDANDNADGSVTIWRLADDTLGANKVSRKTFPTTTDDLYIASTSASDTSIDITILYHDASNIEQTVTTTLTGQTPVDIGVIGLDSNRMFVSSSDDTLTGNVYLTQGNNFTSGVPNDDTKILAFIDSSAGTTEQTTLRIEAGKTCIIKRLYGSIVRGNGSLGSSKLELWVKEPLGSWQRKRRYPIQTGAVLDPDSVQIVIPEGSLVEWVFANISDSDTDYFVEYDYILINN